MKKTCILMTTYNGERFLPQQLTSIQHQTYRDWVLLARDDVSSDDSLAILKKFSQQDSRIEPVHQGHANLGAKNNFALLMAIAEKRGFDYIFLADQDDYWLPEKMQTQLNHMQQLEAQHNPKTPLLVYSNLALVDENLRIIHPSFQRHQKFKHEALFPFSNIITQNIVNGCSILINRSLLRVCLPIPDDAMVHDWWISLLVAATGKVCFIEKTLLYYRQHPSNQIGAPKISPATLKQDFIKRNSKNFLASLRQAQAVAQRLRTLQYEDQAQCAENYAHILHKPFLKKISSFKQYHYSRYGFMRKIILLVRVFLLSRFLQHLSS